METISGTWQLALPFPFKSREAVGMRSEPQEKSHAVNCRFIHRPSRFPKRVKRTRAASAKLSKQIGHRNFTIATLLDTLHGPVYGTDSVTNISRHPTIRFSIV